MHDDATRSNPLVPASVGRSGVAGQACRARLTRHSCMAGTLSLLALAARGDAGFLVLSLGLVAGCASSALSPAVNSAEKRPKPRQVSLAEFHAAPEATKRAGEGAGEGGADVGPPTPGEMPVSPEAGLTKPDPDDAAAGGSARDVFEWH